MTFSGPTDRWEYWPPVHELQLTAGCGWDAPAGALRCCGRLGACLWHTSPQIATASLCAACTSRPRTMWSWMWAQVGLVLPLLCHWGCRLPWGLLVVVARQSLR